MMFLQRKQPPPLTFAVSIVMVLMYIAELRWSWLLESLDLNWKGVVGNFDLHRLNTYPLVHVGIFHLVLNVIAFIPLMERLEIDYGTIRSAILLSNFAVFTGILYFISSWIFAPSTAATNSIAGCSGYVFTILAIYSYRQYRLVSPTISLSNQFTVPSWSPPVILVVLMAIFLPSTSFLGHSSALIIGYLYELPETAISATNTATTTTGGGMGLNKYGKLLRNFIIFFNRFRFQLLDPPNWVLKFIEHKVLILLRLIGLADGSNPAANVATTSASASASAPNILSRIHIYLRKVVAGFVRVDDARVSTGQLEGGRSGQFWGILPTSSTSSDSSNELSQFGGLGRPLGS